MCAGHVGQAVDAGDVEAEGAEQLDGGAHLVAGSSGQVSRHWVRRWRPIWAAGVVTGVVGSRQY